MKQLTIFLLLLIIAIQVANMALDGNELAKSPCGCVATQEALYRSVELLVESDSILNANLDANFHFDKEGLIRLSELQDAVLMHSKFISQLFDHLSRY